MVGAMVLPPLILAARRHSPAASRQSAATDACRGRDGRAPRRFARGGGARGGGRRGGEARSRRVGLRAIGRGQRGRCGAADGLQARGG